ncbi:inner centromere protein-like isoform X2 [Tiliqua scincoides]|uniref:inner centromere protein-like isoform X2 n=1 Tax=Tiliqua scincoides TaxID=71010 RepID=UPI0034625086
MYFAQPGEALVSVMAEARGPTHLLEVCSQKFLEFLFNAEHTRLVWLREIEEEALKMLNRNFSAEPELMPKTPSQKKHKKKKRSFSFKDENKELTRKRLSRRQSSLKPASSHRLSQSKEGLKSIAVEVAASSPPSPGKEILGAPCDKTAMMPMEEGILGIDCNHNIELKEMRNDKTNAIPETFTVCSDGHLIDKTENPDAAGIANSSAVMLSHTIEPTRTEKDWDSSRLSTSTPKASLDGAPTDRGEGFPGQELVSILVQEGDPSQDLKDSTGTSGGSQSGCRPANRPHRSRRVSLVEKYSLSSKRKSMIRKSISRTIAKKKVARDSLAIAATHLSCHSSMEVFVDDEANKRGPSLIQNAESGEALMNMLPKMPNALITPVPIASCAVKSLEMEQKLMFSEESHETKITGSQVSKCENSTQSNHLHEQSYNSWKRGSKQALRELPAAQHSQDACPSSSSPKTTSSPANKIARPFKNFFQTMQKNQLLKSPVSAGHNRALRSLLKRNIPTQPDSKGDFVEKERQRLESLRKKQEAEQQRRQKVEEEKRRRLEEIKLKREERLRKALQARERVEQMEEEKKKRMGQKIFQHEERIEKVREEEKTKKKLSTKKMGEAETRKQKVLQVEEEKQEQPEKWKTVGEIKKMLEHNSVKQEKEWARGQKDKEKWVKPVELAMVTEEEEDLKEDKRPGHLKVPQQEKRIKEASTVPSAGKWLNITAQKSAVGSPSKMNPQILRNSKVLKVNPNDYGMDLNSDDSTDDESQPRKPIPFWASGLQLNEAVTYQYYNPPDINKFFGQILSPKLEDIFYKSKPRYFKRTSSAVWQSPPLPKTVLRTSNSMKKY